jgi:hypothetical protein
MIVFVSESESQNMILGRSLPVILVTVHSHDMMTSLLYQLLRAEKTITHYTTKQHKVTNKL